MIKNPSANAGDTGSILCPHVTGQLSPRAATTGALETQQEKAPQ